MAIGTSQEIIEVRLPALFADARLDDFVALASLNLSESVFGDKYAYAVALLSMHMYSKDQSGTGAGGVKSEKEGDLARSFGGSMTDKDYGTTSFGQELQQLINNCVISARTSAMATLGF